MVAKKIKPMDDVPKGVSARFAETNARLAKAAASRNRSGKKITTGKPVVKSNKQVIKPTTPKVPVKPKGRPGLRPGGFGGSGGLFGTKNR